MLLLPGHSPRQIVLSTPSSLSKRGTVVAVGGGKGSPPLASCRALPIVLDEDCYVAAIEKIVERDFFPDIPSLGMHVLTVCRGMQQEALQKNQGFLIPESLRHLLKRIGKSSSQKSFSSSSRLCKKGQGKV